MNGYSVSIKESSRELTAKQRVALKDTTSAIKLDEATQVEPVTINVDMFGRETPVEIDFTDVKKV